MKLRLILVLPVFISLVLIALYSPAIIETFKYITASVSIDVMFVVLVGFAIIFQIAGHLIRSKKATILFNPIEHSKVTTQLRAFGIGQLFNNLLPLRLGEFIRTAVISQKLNISYLYTFSLIVFERALDLVFVAIGAILAVLLIMGHIPMQLLLVLLSLLAIGFMGVSVVFILRAPPTWLLKFIYTATRIFNTQLKSLIRFKVWSLSYGLNMSLSGAVLKKYMAMTLGMWVSYLMSTFFVGIALLHNTDPLGGVAAAFSPYVGIAAPAGPAGLGVFSSGVQAITQVVTGSSSTVFAIISWLVILVPISLIGVASIPKTAEPIWKRRKKGSSDASLANKVIRNEDVSGELEHFLEGYFRGNKPSLIVNRLEHDGELRLVKYFRGGSDAITILALSGRNRTVKKIIPIELKDRLKAQYDWLKKYSNDVIVSVSGEKTAMDYYSIDIAYDKTSVSMFDYVHEIPLKKAENLLADAWRGLNNSVYGKDTKTVSDSRAIEEYINKHILGCIDKAAEVDPEIRRVTEAERITINGVEYDNIYQILKKIKKNRTAWHDLYTYQSSGVVHGDMILDNLLYSRADSKVIIIDPAPDGNIIEGPVFDFGKAAQSLYCGYEFLLRDESCVEYKNNEIVFSESKSLRFSELDIFMRDTLAKQYLTEGERRAILFHAGALFLRRLKHQVNYTPDNVLKFYGVGVRTLNQFLDQYDDV